jgi:hypothetical protein
MSIHCRTASRVLNEQVLPSVSLFTASVCPPRLLALEACAVHWAQVGWRTCPDAPKNLPSRASTSSSSRPTTLMGHRIARPSAAAMCTCTEASPGHLRGRRRVLSARTGSGRPVRQELAEPLRVTLDSLNRSDSGRLPGHGGQHPHQPAMAVTGSRTSCSHRRRSDARAPARHLLRTLVDKIVLRADVVEIHGVLPTGI